MKKQLIIPAAILIFLITATTLVILYGRGFRLSFKQEIPQISKTGLLVANSTPNGAQVFVDGHLTTATDNTINLPPGTYNIKIQKDGYFPWQKKLKVDEEIVTKAEARLFPLAPKLESIATKSVIDPIIDPSGTKVAFKIASESSARKNGIYVLNMNTTNIPVPVLTVQSSSTQIADDTIDNFSVAEIKWSPDSTELLAEVPVGENSTTSYLLRSDRLNNSPQDVTAILQSVTESWLEQENEKNLRLINNVDKKIRKLINENFKIISWSPDETKILYQASSSGTLPLLITPRRLGIDTLSENRDIEKNKIYIYDTKEDVNITIPASLNQACQENQTTSTANNILESESSSIPTEAAPTIDQNSISINNTVDQHYQFRNCALPIKWFPDSEHLIYLNDKKIIIMDDDGSNNITIYAGPFVDKFAAPWPDSSKIVILTNLNNPDTSPTLYTIGLK